MTEITKQLPETPRMPNVILSTMSHSLMVGHRQDGTIVTFRQKRDPKRWKQVGPWEVKIYTDKKWWQFWKPRARWVPIVGEPPRYGARYVLEVCAGMKTETSWI